MARAKSKPTPASAPTSQASGATTKPKRVTAARPGRAQDKGSAKAGGFTDDEKLAMKERAAELKKEKARSSKGASTDGEADILSKIEILPEPERALIARLHALVRAVAPSLEPRTWYGMPAYAKGGKVLCFIQSAHKFKTRYATFGFSDVAKLDDGALWPTAYAVKRLDKATEASLSALIVRAVG